MTAKLTTYDPAEDLESDEVLVCHVSDPSWTALFLVAGAVVVDVGVKDPDVKKNPDGSLGLQKDGFHGLVQTDLIDTRMVVQGPVGDTGWKFALAGRQFNRDLSDSRHQAHAMKPGDILEDDVHQRGRVR